MGSPSPIRVALDAMGGDYAPEELVKGALLAQSQGTAQVLLVGDSQLLELELQKQGVGSIDIEIVSSQGIIREGEPPVQALQQNPKASIVVATELVKTGEVDACVTMGSTGAAMAVAVFLLGTMEGIDRPALGGPAIGFTSGTVLIDLGSTVDCRPNQLVDYGVMGTVFARTFLGIQHPTVGLLTVGAESGKGNRQIRESYDLLQQSGLNFIGNIEGTDLPAGKATVVVCDGFVGNVLMKYTESLGGEMASFLQERLQSTLSQEHLSQLTQEVFQRTNIVETLGGGPLFGVNGVSIVGHGRAKAPAIASAIGMAKRAIEEQFVSRMSEELAKIRHSLKDSQGA
jgi:glycerol-3-phosphate acyltransferase PlsX